MASAWLCAAHDCPWRETGRVSALEELSTVRRGAFYDQCLPHAPLTPPPVNRCQVNSKQHQYKKYKFKTTHRQVLYGTVLHTAVLREEHIEGYSVDCYVIFPPGVGVGQGVGQGVGCVVGEPVHTGAGGGVCGE